MLRSVVWRLRLGHAVIALLVLLLLLVGWFGLQRIQQTEQDLIGRSVPDLLRVELLGRRLNDLLRDLENLEAISTPEVLERRQSDFAHSFNELFDVFSPAEFTDPSLFSAFIGPLENLQLSAEDAVSLHRLRLTLAANETLNRDRLDAAFDTLRAQIEPLVIDTGSEVEKSLLADPQQPTSDRQSNNGLAKTVQDFSRLTQLMLSLDVMRRTSQSAASAETDDQLQEQSNRLSFGFRSAAQLLASLPDSPQRMAVATGLRDIRAKLFQEGGLIEIRRQQIVTAEEIAEEQQRRFELLEALSSASNQLIEDASDNISAAASVVNQNIKTTIVGLSVMGLLAIFIIILIVWLIVERQVIGRLAQLANSVRQIADGNDKHEVLVAGTDELGDMASALGVFKENSRELRRSNEELARFAYAASHDLRSPLRAIGDLATWTLEDAGDQIPQEAREHLLLLQRRVDRLSRLLNDLLDYASVGREESSVKPVDIGGLADEIIELLSPDGRFSVVMENEVPEFTTYDAPLRQILMNLFSNAIKHHDRDEGSISVRASRRHGALSIEISDDGPGIPERFHGQIFELFQTLKPRDRVEGSGMGLAIVRKLVERYGGSIDLDSDPDRGRGTVFRFTWPVLNTNHTSAAA